MPNFTPLSELIKLFDHVHVINNKIQTIKMLRTISGEGLKETKDFVEQTLIPALQSQSPGLEFNVQAGHEEQPNLHTTVPLPPPMYLVGHSYKQRNKNTVLIIGVSNFNTEAETVYSMDGNGTVVHRYNRRDFGRVTGTDHNNPDPRNLELVQ